MVRGRIINVRPPRHRPFVHVRRNTAARRITEAVRAVGRINRARRNARRGPTGMARTAAIGAFRRNWAARRVTQAVRAVGNIRRARAQARARRPGYARRVADLLGLSYRPMPFLAHDAPAQRFGVGPVRSRADPFEGVYETYGALRSMADVSRLYNPSMREITGNIPTYTDSDGKKKYLE